MVTYNNKLILNKIIKIKDMDPDFEYIIIKNFFNRKMRRHINQLGIKFIQFENLEKVF